MSLRVWSGRPSRCARKVLIPDARYPPFVSNSRHVTRQKILNWKQALRFPSRPRVSHEGVELMQRLLCEPEDRLGSQSTVSTSRPNSLIMSVRRSGFFGQMGGSTSIDGAEHIKVKWLLPPGATEAGSGRWLTVRSPICLLHHAPTYHDHARPPVLRAWYSRATRHGHPGRVCCDRSSVLCYCGCSRRWL